MIKQTNVALPEREMVQQRKERQGQTLGPWLKVVKMTKNWLSKVWRHLRKVPIYVPCTLHMFRCSAKLPKLVTNESVWQKSSLRSLSQSWDDGAGAVAWGNQVYCPPSILPSIALPSPLHCIAFNCIALLYLDASPSTLIYHHRHYFPPNQPTHSKHHVLLKHWFGIRNWPWKSPPPLDGKRLYFGPLSTPFYNKL